MRSVISAFEAELDTIGTPTNGLKSNEVLAVVSNRLEELEFIVEGSAKVSRPVLFGENDRPTKTNNVDGYHEASGTVVCVRIVRDEPQILGHLPISRILDRFPVDHDDSVKWTSCRVSVSRELLTEDLP